MTLWGAIVAPRELPEPPEPVRLDDASWPDALASSATATPDLAGGIRALYQKCHFYDVFLVCGRSRFPAHQAVLAAASPKLCDMLRQARAGLRAEGEPLVAEQSQQAGQHLELSVPGGYTPATVGALLDFIYNLGGYSAADDEANVEVMRLATEFELPGLKAEAAHWLGGHLTVANAIPMLAVCEDFGLSSLSEQIKERLTSDTQALLQVSQEVSARKHPEILQTLLMRMATQSVRRTSTPSPDAKNESTSGSSPEKREAPPPKKATKQMAKRFKS